MSSCCLLCGVEVYDDPTERSEWTTEYRLIYRESKNVRLSGVGRVNDAETWDPPRDPLLRYDDDLVFETLPHRPLMKRTIKNDFISFALHEACWKVLNKATSPKRLSLNRLMAVCESLPFPSWSKRLAWGHTYAGVQSYHDEWYYPWTERYLDYDEIEWDMMVEGALDDPSDRSFLPLIVPSPLQSLGIKNFLQRAVSTPQNDPFSHLPWEIWELIARDLPTSSAMNLRLASPFFTQLFTSLTFWSSRFEPDADRGFMHEVRESMDQGVLKMIGIYRVSKRLLSVPRGLNRERVWSLARTLASYVEETPRYSYPDPGGHFDPVDSELWTRLAGQEQDTNDPSWLLKFNSGCHSIDSVELSLPADIIKIGIAIFEPKYIDIVTGIRFISSSGQQQLAGYGFDKHEKLYDVDGFHGFHVAMAIGGLRALQIVDGNQNPKSWAGCSERVPICDRLVTEAPVRTLRVEFDAYKITALASPTETIPATQSIRQTAVWYPSVPPKVSI